MRLLAHFLSKFFGYFVGPGDCVFFLPSGVLVIMSNSSCPERGNTLERRQDLNNTIEMFADWGMFCEIVLFLN